MNNNSITEEGGDVEKYIKFKIGNDYDKKEIGKKIATTFPFCQLFYAATNKNSQIVHGFGSTDLDLDYVFPSGWVGYQIC